eukprot:scaffold161828_cov86-Attheya_sp.AAC.2
MQLVVYSWFSLLVIYSWFSLLVIYSWSLQEPVSPYYHHAHRDIVQTSDTTIISTTPSTTSITIQDIEQRVKRFIYLYKNQYHHEYRDIVETSDTTIISTTPSATSITVQDKYVASIR